MGKSDVTVRPLLDKIKQAWRKSGKLLVIGMPERSKLPEGANGHPRLIFWSSKQGNNFNDFPLDVVGVLITRFTDHQVCDKVKSDRPSDVPVLECATTGMIRSFVSELLTTAMLGTKEDFKATRRGRNKSRGSEAAPPPPIPTTPPPTEEPTAVASADSASATLGAPTPAAPELKLFEPGGMKRWAQRNLEICRGLKARDAVALLVDLAAEHGYLAKAAGMSAVYRLIEKEALAAAAVTAQPATPAVDEPKAEAAPIPTLDGLIEGLHLVINNLPALPKLLEAVDENKRLRQVLEGIHAETEEVL